MFDPPCVLSAAVCCFEIVFWQVHEGLRKWVAENVSASVAEKVSSLAGTGPPEMQYPQRHNKSLQPLESDLIWYERMENRLQPMEQQYTQSAVE